MHTITVPMESLVSLIRLQLEQNGHADLTVTGSSMLPMLRNRRDSVRLIPVVGKCKKGDIILYRRENGMYVLHRVIGLQGTQYICCGDNQAEREDVMHNQLIAVVSGFTRKGEYFSVTHWGYRVYQALLVGLFFLRPLYIKLRRPLGRLKGRLRKKYRK